MLHYLIKITENSLPALIVFCPFLCLAARCVRKGERGFLYLGIVPGLAAALLYTAIKRGTGVPAREYYDLCVLMPSLVLGVVMLVASGRVFGEKSGNASGGMVRVLAVPLLAVWTAGLIPNALLYPFEFAAGMESVFNTDVLLRAMGYSSGLLLLLLLGLGLYKISSALPRNILWAFFTPMLVFFFAKQLVDLAQILVARSMVPRSPWLMSLVIFALTHADWFAFALMGLAAALTVFVIMRVRRIPVVQGNPADRRKQRAERRTLFRYSTCVFFCLAASGLILTLVRNYANLEAEISPPVELAAVDEKIRIPLETVNDGNLYRFQYKTPEGVFVRYIVIKKSDSAYGVGLDACDICGPSGYYQRKNQVICKLCDVVMNIATIGFPGGCNPVPLRFAVERGTMVILTKDLNAESQRFR